MIWFDYILVFILILNLYKGLKEGLLYQVAALISFFIAFYAALFWNSDVRSLLEKYLNLEEAVTILCKGEGASSWLVDILMNVAAFLLAFLAIYFLLKFLGRRLAILRKIPFIGPVNAVLGALIGLLKGTLLIFLIIALFSLLKTEFWINTLESSAVVALSDHYISALFEFIFNFVVKNLGILI